MVKSRALSCFRHRICCLLSFDQVFLSPLKGCSLTPGIVYHLPQHISARRPDTRRKGTILLQHSGYTKMRPILMAMAFSIPILAIDTCPKSYKQCKGSLDAFCCPSSAECIDLDDASSVICCPKGENCAYIQTISCDVQQQNSTLHPQNQVQTTRLDDELPRCGGSCCPFGYECHGDVCALTSASTSSTHTTAASPTSTTGTTITPVSKTEHTPSPSALADKSVAPSNCPDFTTDGILAGFFPGAVFGAILTALIAYCLQRRRANRPSSSKVQNVTKRTSNGLIGISDPIPSDDTALRTDFLLCPEPRGSSSRLHRTRSRVRSFWSTHSNNGHSRSEDSDIPSVPPLPLPIKAHDGNHYPHPYPPPQCRTAGYVGGGGASEAPKFLDVPFPAGSGRDTTFTELIDRIGFRNGKGEPCYPVEKY